MTREIIKIFFLCISIIILNVSDASASQTTSTISAKEKEDLDFFLKYLFVKLDLGFLLFGDKAASLEVNLSEFSILDFCLNRQTQDQTLEKYWYLCEKKINQNNLLFRKISYFLPNNELATEYFILNKKNCKKIFFLHSNLFFKYFGTNNAAQILQKIENYGLNRIADERIKGLLLGYGLHNSTLFFKRKLIFERIASFCCMPVDNVHYSQNLDDIDLLDIFYKPRPPQTFIKDEKLVQNYCEYNSCLNFELAALSQKDPLSPIPLPNFSVDQNHPETRQFLRKYEKLRPFLTKIFQSDNFLQLIYDKICQ